MSEPTVTPMMAQYLAIREANPGALLFYRMGDFYEMFFDDAVAAAAALDIALTKRGQHLGQDIPMCGVPVHAAEGYLLTLIRKGFRVAIAEQMEDPAEAKKRGSKSVVARDVVRLVTPGTLTEESLLEARRHNFLAAWAEVRDEGALAWVDISTGEFRVMPCSLVRLGPELARLAPREVLVSEAREADCAPLVAEARAALTPLSRASFDSQGGERRLCAAFAVGSLEAFGAFGRAELSAMGAIADYLDLTQRGKLPLLRAPLRESPGGTMQIDAATRRNLELTQALSGGRDGSLLVAIDRTVTAPGARLLERRISAPSRDLGEIRARHAAVRFLLGEPRLAEDLRADLRRVPDMDRALSRLALDRGGPRDMAAIRNGLEQAGHIAARLTAS
ncbi:DNA mismatch repair protein MutS, partial [Candidatus Falkowbacteria bacterium]|nr:DNA mismatch repair protein MutS [Candidatus Falkowbacteria bacterium]